MAYDPVQRVQTASEGLSARGGGPDMEQGLLQQSSVPTSPAIPSSTPTLDQQVCHLRLPTSAEFSPSKVTNDASAIVPDEAKQHSEDHLRTFMKSFIFRWLSNVNHGLIV